MVDGKLSLTVYGYERTFHRRNELYYFSYKRWVGIFQVWKNAHRSACRGAPAGAVLKKEGHMAKFDIIAATGCPTGIAHTFMAKEALEKAAAERGLTIKVETHGQVGVNWSDKHKKDCHQNHRYSHKHRHRISDIY